MIVVTGATGRLGRRIVEQLLARLPAERIAVSVRDPAKAESLRARGVRVRAGDFDDPASLRASLAGAAQVLIVSSNSGGEATPEQHRNAIDAAIAVGGRRIVYTSHMGARPDSPFRPMRSHAATEAMLAASGVPFTALRNGYYIGSAIALIGDARETGTIAVPADGPVAWTAHDDLAEAAALALTTDGLLDAITPPLTGRTALDFAAIAGIVTEHAGRAVRRVVVDDAAFIARLVASGVRESYAATLAGSFAASRHGDFATVDPTLERILGRAPLSFRDVLSRERR
jgi:uncharacterized protein YbjT (DUF2867 family)